MTLAAYTVIFSKLAEERFDRIIRADRRLGEQIARAISRLAQNPERGKSLQGASWKGYRKYRSGNYRIIYRIEKVRLVVFVLTLGDRKDIYD